MEYSININQKAIVDAGLLEKGMDLVDAAIIDYIRKFRGVNESKKIVRGDVIYVWIAQTKLIEEMPLIRIGTKRGMGKRLRKLEEMGLILPHPNNQKLAKSYFALTNLGQSLYHKPRNHSSEVEQNLGTPVPEPRNSRSYDLGTPVPEPRNHSSDNHYTNSSIPNQETKSIEKNSPAFDPVQEIKSKILSASTQQKQIWKARFSADPESLAFDAEDFAAWWISKQGGKSENTIKQQIKQTAPRVFQMSFQTSWLNNKSVFKSKRKVAAKESKILKSEDGLAAFGIV